MKKVVGIGVAVLLLIAIAAGGYLFLRKAAHKPKVAILLPIVPPAPATGDMLRVFTACGRPRNDHTVLDTTRRFAGGSVRTVDYYATNDKTDDTAVYLRFDQPAAGWRFRGASTGPLATGDDLSIDQLTGLLPCAAKALTEEPPVPPPTPAPAKQPPTK